MQKLKIKLKNLKHSSHIIALSKGGIFAKNADFLQKNSNISKIERVLVLKDISSETTFSETSVYICTKFQISSIILTSFI